MFGLFIPKKKEPLKNSVQERIANKIVRTSIRLQEKWAAFMQRKSERLSYRSKKYGIILFCLLAGGYSLYTIIESFSGKKQKSFVITNIKVSSHLTQTGEENTKNGTIIREIEFKKIQHFRAWMDSLDKSGTGRKVADSILQARPGLMDSIIQLEQLYHLQQSYKK